MNNNQTIPVEAQQKATESVELAKRYENFSIATAEVYAGAGEDLKIVKTKIKDLDDLRKSLTKPLDESKKRIMEFFNRPLDVLAGVEATIKSAMLTWQREQERIRWAEQSRLMEVQRKEAERLQKLAAKAEQKGKMEKAEEFQNRAMIVESSVPVVESKVDKIEGIKTKLIWKFRIVDVSKIPREYMIPNEKTIGEIARATKGAAKIEGIEFYSEETLAAGRY